MFKNVLNLKVYQSGQLCTLPLQTLIEVYIMTLIFDIIGDDINKK